MSTTERRIAEARIHRLFELAEAASSIERATQYVERAREVAERSRVRVPGELKNRFCDGCGRYLRPGDNARARLRSDRGHVSIRCLDCGATNRRPYDGMEEDG